MKTFLAALPLSAILLVAPALAEAPFSFDSAPGRLPKDVRPLAYRVDLTPDLAKLAFTGHEEIDVDVTKPTSRFVLDLTSLKIAKAELAEGGQATIATDAKAETVTLAFPQSVAAGHHVLSIDFAGTIPESPAGLYYDDYQNRGRTERMLVTQFESTDARRMFPGWDEPAFKATFRLAVTIPKDLAAVSNMPVQDETAAGTDSGGRPLKRVEFAETPKMSSYLLELTVGNLEAMHGKAGKTEIGVWTEVGKAQKGTYALEAATAILPYYEDYFGVPYPLPKLDLIAVPGNFAAGAMENWGAITFIDNDLLFDPATSSPRTREAVFTVVAHEMAHLWSGDLVTLGWWDNIWLNEGFANWMENNATDKFNPDWQIWLRARASKERAMTTDARRYTHALQQAIADESEVDDEFDEISYDKGAAVIRMIETWLGPDKFRDGMRRYMAAHAYSNTTSADLWAALGAASGQNVATVAGSFTEQPGVPLVDVSARCAGGSTEVALSQDRFTVHYADALKLKWRIPVRLALAGRPAQAVLVGPDGAKARLQGCGAVIANAGDVGYYRVVYDAAAMAAVTQAFPTLPAADKGVLLGDQWALVTAGKTGPAGWLGLVRQLPPDSDLAVWEPVIDRLETLDLLMRDSPDRAAFRAFASELLRPILGLLGWDAKPGEKAEATLLRADVIGAMGRFRDPAVVAEAGKRFAAFLADPQTLSPGNADAVLRTVAIGADKPTYEKLRALGRAASGSEAKLRYYHALASAQDPALLDETVEIGLTDEVPPGRINRLLIETAHLTDHPERVWRGVIAHADAILPKLAGEEREGLLAHVADATGDPKIAAELLARPESNANRGARRQAEQAAETIAIDAELMRRVIPAIGAWLHQAGNG